MCIRDREKLAVEQLQQTVPEKICRLPECKDDTDMLAAIKRGLESVSYTHLDVYKRQQYVQSGTITAKIRGTGTVESGDPYNVKIAETRTISKMCIRDRPKRVS